MTLRLAPVWWGIGMLLALAVVVLSLVPQGEGPALLPDKLAHFIAYLVLGVWFVSLAVRKPLLAVAGVIALGGCVELLQGFTPDRQPEWLDFIANVTGVALGYLFVRFVSVNIFGWLEQRLLVNAR